MTRRPQPAWLFHLLQAIRSPETAHLAAELRRIEVTRMGGK